MIPQGDRSVLQGLSGLSWSIIFDHPFLRSTLRIQANKHLNPILNQQINYPTSLQSKTVNFLIINYCQVISLIIFSYLGYVLPELGHWSFVNLVIFLIQDMSFLKLGIINQSCRLVKPINQSNQSINQSINLVKSIYLVK